MSAPLRPFALATVAVLDWVDLVFGADLGGFASTDAPLAGVTPLPHVQVYGFGGSRDRLNDHPVIDLQVFAADYLTAANLAERIDTALMGYPLVVSSSGRSVLIDYVEVVSPAAEVPWDSLGSIRRFQASYSLSLRR